jgi:hypothetical protein
MQWFGMVHKGIFQMLRAQAVIFMLAIATLALNPAHGASLPKVTNATPNHESWHQLLYDVQHFLWYSPLHYDV